MFYRYMEWSIIVQENSHFSSHEKTYVNDRSWNKNCLQVSFHRKGDRVWYLTLDTHLALDPSWATPKPLTMVLWNVTMVRLYHGQSRIRTSPRAIPEPSWLSHYLVWMSLWDTRSHSRQCSVIVILFQVTKPRAFCILVVVLDLGTYEGFRSHSFK